MNGSFRYDGGGAWFRGNTHIHSTSSDGGRTLEELAAQYRLRGYDFFFLTDHWVASAVDPSTMPLLVLDGIELDGLDAFGGFFHVACLGRVQGITPEMGLEAALEEVERQGALRILAHPHWSGNTFDEAARHRFDGIEIYNHVCTWLNGKGSASCLWDLLLERQGDIVGVASDDAHITAEHPGWDGGWIWVKAGACTGEEILAAIRAGRFYSSAGPRFYSLELVDGSVAFRSSPVRFARLAGPAWRGARTGSFDGPLITEGSFAIPDDWAYARLEVEDEAGRKAWTNTLLIGEAS